MWSVEHCLRIVALVCVQNSEEGKIRVGRKMMEKRMKKKKEENEEEEEEEK